MNKKQLYGPEQIPSRFKDMVTVYQEAFSGWPWFEVSKCADKQQRCAGGFSNLAVGQNCRVCLATPTQPAYGADELIERFEQVATTKNSTWYIEESKKGVSLAAVFWKTDASTLAKEKYDDTPAMAEWLQKQLGDSSFIYLDEIFADKTIRPQGNLANFGELCRAVSTRLDDEVIVFRTINPALSAAAVRDFNALFCERETAVPDRRDFVVINIGETV